MWTSQVSTQGAALRLECAARAAVAIASSARRIAAVHVARAQRRQVGESAAAVAANARDRHRNTLESAWRGAAARRCAVASVSQASAWCLGSPAKPSRIEAAPPSSSEVSQRWRVAAWAGAGRSGGCHRCETTLSGRRRPVGRRGRGAGLDSPGGWRAGLAEGSSAGRLDLEFKSAKSEMVLGPREASADISGEIRWPSRS